MLHFLTPNLRIDRVEELSLQKLRELQLDALLLDVDCTLKRYHQEDVSAEVAAWLRELREADIGLCLLSNGMGPRIERFAEKLDLPFTAQALKPLPSGCKAAVRKMGFDPGRTAMVGDQLFADVMAGRLAGLKSILVNPLHPEDEPWFTRVKRPFERLLLGMQKGRPDTQA